jgi:hypothetical protein
MAFSVRHSTANLLQRWKACDGRFSKDEPCEDTDVVQVRFEIVKVCPHLSELLVGFTSLDRCVAELADIFSSVPGRRLNFAYHLLMQGRGRLFTLPLARNAQKVLTLPPVGKDLPGLPQSASLAFGEQLPPKLIRVVSRLLHRRFLRLA